jgi:manganese/zinc/iron transport system permease protein
MSAVAFWTILVALLCNIACAVVGCYLVLRRLSLLGDAISHGVLPGIVLAFLLTGQRSPIFILFGAMACGLLTAFLTQTLHTFGKVPEDASMGAVFTGLFALGVLLISKFARQIDLDARCVFEGLLELVPDRLDDVLPRLLIAFTLTIGFVILFWKELKIASFDPGLAQTMGVNPTLMHYLLMALVAGVTVASFEAVGSILIIAMLIVPGACGHLLSDRLAGMMLWAVAIAASSTVLGYRFAEMLDTNIAGMMSVAAGAQFALVVLLAPRHGIVVRVWRNVRLSLQIIAEDILAALYRREEGTVIGPIATGAAGWRTWLAAHQLRRTGEIERAPDGGWVLTAAGRARAQSLVRSHRLWETFLEKNLGLPPDHLHAPAERMEHFIGPSLQEQLAAELDRPGIDPHGKAIPPAKDS